MPKNTKISRDENYSRKLRSESDTAELKKSLSFEDTPDDENLGTPGINFIDDDWPGTPGLAI